METKDDQHTRCRECGQPVVSGDAGTGGGGNQRVKRRGISRTKRGRLPAAEAAGDSGGGDTGREITVSFGFSLGHFEGTARVIQKKPLVISFPWGDGWRQIQIAESEVVG